MIEELPKVIQNHILEKTSEKFIRENNRISVTELLYCIRKAYYQRVNPKPLSLQHAWYIYRGELFDEVWTSLFSRNQLTCTHRIRDVPVVIVGRADFIDEDGAVADLKTHANLKWLEKPKPEHVMQVRFYGWCLAVPKARLYYVDFRDCKNFDVEIGDVEADVLEPLESLAVELYSCLEKKVPPFPQKSWVCKFCEYREECERDGE